MSYPNPAEQNLHLEQFFQRIENKQRHGVQSYKNSSTKSYAKKLNVPSKANKDLLKRSKFPLAAPKKDHGSVHRLSDPKFELERQRNLTNRQKYSPANLRLARISAQSSPIPKQNSKESEINVKVVLVF
jgi:hypothetical protein